MITKGTQVSIKPEYQDDGDNSFTWVTIDDEDKGRVTLQTQVNETIMKTEIFQVFMLETM